MILDNIDEFLNPTLLGIAFAFSLITWWLDGMPPIRYWFILWFGAAAVFGLHYLDQRYALGGRIGIQFVAPLATTIALALTLCFGHRNWGWLLAPLLFAYIAYNIHGHYLFPVDTFATAAIIVLVMSVAWWVTGQLRHLRA